MPAAIPTKPCFIGKGTPPEPAGLWPKERKSSNSAEPDKEEKGECQNNFANRKDMVWAKFQRKSQEINKGQLRVLRWPETPAKRAAQLSLNLVYRHHPFSTPVPGAHSTRILPTFPRTDKVFSAGCTNPSRSVSHSSNGSEPLLPTPQTGNMRKTI